jgi:hypothetical protein
VEQKINSFISTILILLFSLNSISTLADICDVAPIKKGAAAPCDGFYFNKDAENQAEQYRADADFYKKLSTAQGTKTQLMQDENDTLQKRLNLYIQESKDLSKQQAKSETTETLIRIGFFSLGVIVTALIARNVRN